MPSHHKLLDPTLVFVLHPEEKGDFSFVGMQVDGQTYDANACGFYFIHYSRSSVSLFFDTFSLWKEINPAANVFITTLQTLPTAALLHSLQEASKASTAASVIWGSSGRNSLQLPGAFEGERFFSENFRKMADQCSICNGQLLPLDQRTYRTSSSVYIRSCLVDIAQGCQGIDDFCTRVLRRGYSIGKEIFGLDDLSGGGTPLYMLLSMHKGITARLAQWIMFHLLSVQWNETGILFSIYKVLKTAMQCRNGKHTLLFVAHSSYWEKVAGGTENHLRQLEKLLVEQGHLVVAFAPSHQKSISLHISSAHCRYDTTFPGTLFYEVSDIVTRFADVLHVHHTVRWNTNHLEYLLKASCCTKIFSAHDFYALCPSVDLLTGSNRMKHCLACTNAQICNTCLSDVWRYSPADIVTYRERSEKFLTQFSRILFPSAFMFHYYVSCLPAASAHIAAAGECFPHSLAYITDVLKSDVVNGKGNVTDSVGPHPLVRKTLGFIGNIRAHKGFNILREASPQLAALGFRIVVFGTLADKLHADIAVQTYPFQGAKELRTLLNTHGQPDFLCHLSLCAETFSFTFFEGLLLSPLSIPIVGPFGNPAEICTREKIGPVLSQSSAAAFLEALQDASANADAYRERLQRFVHALCANAAGDDYLGRYLVLVAPQNTTIKSHENDAGTILSRMQYVSHTLHYADMFNRKSVYRTLQAIWAGWAKPLFFGRIAKRLCKWLTPC